MCAIDLLFVINQYFNMVSHHQYHYRNSSVSAAVRNLSSVCCHNIYIRHFSPLQSAVDITHHTTIPNNPFYLAATVLDIATQIHKRHSSTIKCHSYTILLHHINIILMPHSTVKVAISIHAPYFMAPDSFIKVLKVFNAKE